jgi:hypothetical protein
MVDEMMRKISWREDMCRQKPEDHKRAVIYAERQVNPKIVSPLIMTGSVL